MTPMDIDELSVVLPATTTSSLSLLLYVEIMLPQRIKPFSLHAAIPSQF